MAGAREARAFDRLTWGVLGFLALILLSGCAYDTRIPPHPRSETLRATQELMDVKVYQIIASQPVPY